ARSRRPRRSPARGPARPGRAGCASQAARASSPAVRGGICSGEETRRPRPPPDQPGDRGPLRRHRRRLRPPLARTRSRARAWGGGLSRLLLLRRLGDRDAPLLPDPRRFAGQPTQEVELGAAHATLAHQLDLRDRRRVQGEDALHAHAGRDLPDGERGVDRATARFARGRRSTIPPVHPFRDSSAAGYSSAARASRRNASPWLRTRGPPAPPGAAVPPHPVRTAPPAHRPRARSRRPTAPPLPARLPPAAPRPCSARTTTSAAGPPRTAPRHGG